MPRRSRRPERVRFPQIALSADATRLAQLAEPCLARIYSSVDGACGRMSDLPCKASMSGRGPAQVI